MFCQQQSSIALSHDECSTYSSYMCACNNQIHNMHAVAIIIGDKLFCELPHPPTHTHTHTHTQTIHRNWPNRWYILPSTNPDLLNCLLYLLWSLRLCDLLSQ